MAHNGNLINTADLAQQISDGEADGQLDLQVRVPVSSNDTSVVTRLLAHHPDQSVEERALELLPQIRGAFSFIWMDAHTI